MDKKHISKIYHNGDTLYVKDAEARETMVSGVSYDTTNKKIVETINGVNSDVVSVSTIKSDLNLTKSDVSLSNVTNDAQVKRTEMGVASGVATLDSAGKVPASQLPSYVDDVVEYASRSAFPETGETGKIYVDIAANEAYRWSGSQYVIISDSQVQANWNTTDATSKSYIQNKPTNVSSFTNDAGYLTEHQSLDNYYNKTQTDSLLGGKQDTLVSGTNIKTINNNSLLGSGNIDIQTGGTYTEGNGIDITNDEISVKAGSNLSFDANGNLNATDTTYSVMGGSGASHASGLVPDPGATAGTTKYLREDGTWQTPAGSSTDIAYDTTNKKITKTVNGVTSDVVTAAKIVSDGGIAPKELVVVNCMANMYQIVIDATVTINSVSYTVPANGVVAAYVPTGTSYSVVGSAMDGFTTPATQSFTAGDGIRNVNLQWKWDGVGVFIEDVNHILYTAAQWESSKTANSIVLITPQIKRRIALVEEQKSLKSSAYPWDSLKEQFPMDYPIEQARLDFNGESNTLKFMAAHKADGQSTNTSCGAVYCSTYVFPDGITKGYLPALGEANAALQNKVQINNCLSVLGLPDITSSGASDGRYGLWSSTPYMIDPLGRGNNWYSIWSTAGDYVAAYGWPVRPFSNY